MGQQIRIPHIGFSADLDYLEDSEAVFKAESTTEHEIRFVVASLHDNLESEDWEERKEHL